MSGSTGYSSEIEVSTMVKSVMTKGMWAGSVTRITIPDIQGAVVDGKSDIGVKLSSINSPHTPALLKAIDEIIVNATDHTKEFEKTPGRVTQIDISYDAQTGRITIRNDGVGMPVKEHAIMSKTRGRTVYSIEVAFSEFHAGTNVVKSSSNVKGGINGIGAKLTNVHSSEFTVEVVDTVNDIHYTQTWRDRKSITEPAIVVDISGGEPQKSYTSISFIPVYGALGYKVNVNGALLTISSRELDAWIRLRAHQSAAYVGSNVCVTYNGVRCETVNSNTLGKLLITQLGDTAEQVVIMTSTVLSSRAPYNLHPWDVSIVILPAGKKAGRRAASQNITIVNGVLSNRGAHVKYIRALLTAAVGARIAEVTQTTRKVTTSEALAGVQIVLCCAVPGADWGGQSKDELQISKAILENYSFSAKFLANVGTIIADRILTAKAKGKKKIVHDKYTPARNAGKSKRAYTYLMAAEGDSAITLLRDGITQNKKKMPHGGPSVDWCGIISLGGVIMNAVKNVTTIETGDGKTVRIRSTKLEECKRINALADAFGITRDFTYETKAERDTLNYGMLLLCVDQDLDGTGKIAPLVLAWIHLFWPNLIKYGMVGRLMTPLIRARPLKKSGGDAVEFYYQSALDDWLVADETRAKRYDIKYYKGLASHDTDEGRAMFTPEAFKEKIYTYTMDDTADAKFNVYFGNSPNLRKIALATPVKHLSSVELKDMMKTQTIPVGRVQLDIDAKSYKADAICRQIPGCVDGLNPARRKVILGAMLRFTSGSSKPIKIYQLGGFVADKCYYHHGDMSLNGTITSMAKSFIGECKYPYLVSVGQFGSRHGDAAGSPRYISVKPSEIVNVVLPPEDRYLPVFVYEDGDRAEPQYFVPTVPMNILESYAIPSEGWAHTSVGRDLESVLSVVEAYIDGDEVLNSLADAMHQSGATREILADIDVASITWPLPPDTDGYISEVRQYRGQPHSFGHYYWDEDTRTITVVDLPMGVHTMKFLKRITCLRKDGTPNVRDEYIESIRDNSSAEEINIEIVLRKGAYDQICAKYENTEFIHPIEAMLLLRVSLKPNLNYYGANGGVLEFKSSYLAALLYWAPIRKKMYFDRLTRIRILTGLKIDEGDAIIRYIAMSAELGLSKIDDLDTASAMLDEHKFPKFNSSLLNRPEYTTNDSLERLVTTGPGATHDYIFNLRERDLVVRSVAKRAAQIEVMHAKHAKVTAQLAERPTPGGSVWLGEIEAFRKCVAK